MTKTWIAGLSAALAMWVGSAAAASPAGGFGPGEQTDYRVRYLGVTAGTARITVGAPTKQFGKDVWPLVALANSNPELGIWPIRDKYVSYWDPATTRVAGSDLFADENKQRRRQRIRLGEDGKSAVVLKQKDGEPASESTHTFDGITQDLAGATFALRTQPMAEGKTYEYPVFTGNKTFTLRATVEGRQMLDTSIGPREVFRVKVQTGFSGKFATNRDMIVFFTADGARVPVRMEADFVLGKIVAEVTEYKQGRIVASSATVPIVDG